MGFSHAPREAPATSGLASRVSHWDSAAATKTFTHPLHLPWLNGIGRQAAIRGIQILARKPTLT